MKIIHVTYARITQPDPDVWLNHLSFFIGILEEMAKRHVVESIHLINHQGKIRRNNILYHFLKISWCGWVLPIRLSKYISECKPDAVVVHGFAFTWQLLWLRLHLGRRVEILVQHHAEVPFSFPKNVLQRFIDRSVGGYFFSSADLAMPWLARNQINNRNKIHEVLELSSPFYSPENEKLKVPSNTYLWVGRLDENKDPVTLVQAFARFSELAPDAVLHVIFRDGHLLEVVREFLLKLRMAENIRLAGAIDHNEMQQWYGRSAFIISTSHYESAGAAVCEAMSCGCIPVLTSIPSFRAMTKNGEVGMLFDPNDVDGLLARLIETRLLDVANERKRVFHHFKENLSFEAIASKMLKVIEAR